MKLKKPKFWDYKKPNFLSYFLLPLTFPVILNNFYLGLKNRVKIKQKTIKICIGNIYVGGTGKTPLTIKIYQILSILNYNTATIKKFYRDQIDEQKILDQKTKLYCLKSRNDALMEAIQDNIDVAIFDDGLQDRSVNFDLKFVCFNNIKWIGNGLLIPAGPLREKITSITKYDAVFINGNRKDNTNLKSLIKKYNKDIHIFESFYRVTNIDKFSISEKYIIFSGIGNPESFKETLIKNNLNIVKEIIFPDNHNYSHDDLYKIKLEAKNLNAKILTTEKDYIKIKSNENYDINFLKIELEIEDERKLINFLKKNI